MTQTATTSGTAPDSGKGSKFFKRAEEVAATGNWDFAIEMYLEGIQREPDNVERGHQPLREVAIKRKASGGKGPGLKDQLTRRQGRDALTNMVNAEYMLGKDPGSVTFMEQVFRAAQKLELPATTKWICEILLEAQRQASKPSKRILLTVAKAMEAAAEYGKAVAACDLAIQTYPGDGELTALQRNLSARYTIQAGKYDQEGDFTRSVADMDKQKELMQRDAMVQDQAFLAKQIEKARQEYLETPTIPGKINALADALLKFEDESYENEAIDVLAKAHRDTGAYQFKMRTGDIRMRQMQRRYRQMVEAGDRDGATEQARRQLAFELDEYTERAANYPTDLGIKFELGRRQMLAGKLDEAIASLQQAQRDPRRALRASSLVGQAFARKGWYKDAADTFRRALGMEMSEERGKELRYNLGDVLEKMGDLKGADEQFAAIAQVDYNYKDVRQRLEGLRAKLREAAQT